MRRIRLPIHWTLKRIEQADVGETDEIITSVIKCYSRLHPEYELVVLSLPKIDIEKRNVEIDRIATCLKKEYVKEYVNA